MSRLQAHRWQRLRWVGVGAVATLAALGLWLVGLAREQTWASIRAAADAERWNELEAGLRQWLGRNPRDDKAWMMLGSVLFDRGREEGALPALRRVREADEGWSHARTLL